MEADLSWNEGSDIKRIKVIQKAVKWHTM